MNIENISRLVLEKSHDGKVPEIIHDHVQEVENSLERLNEKYQSLKNHRNDLDHMGVEWDDVRRKIREIVEDIIRY